MTIELATPVEGTPRKPEEWTHDELLATTVTMQRYGGSFARHISEATVVADKWNKLRLLQAFPEMFEMYGPGSDFFPKNV